MAQPPKPRRQKPAEPESRPGRSWGAAVQALRPDLTGRGLARLGTRSLIAGGAIGLLAVLAHWKAIGFLDRNGLSKLVEMKGAPEQPQAAGPKRDGLDRGRLKAVVTGAAAPR